jgi:PAS domain S-box-containing protein
VDIRQFLKRAFPDHSIGENLREDAEGALYRGKRTEDDQAILFLTSTVDHPTAEWLARLDREYSLRDDLDLPWAARPLALVRPEGRMVLLLEDPGGRPLDAFERRRVPVSESLRIALNVASCLSRVHAKGLIHMDLKPAHILADPAMGAIALTGFGFATAYRTERQGPGPPEAQADTVVGTLAYMAPEQTGRMNRPLDARADLYALGVVLYEILTGKLPFSATDPSKQLLHSHLARPDVPPAEVDPALPSLLSELVMKLLAKSPEARYQTALGVEADLRRALAEWEAMGCLTAFPLAQADLPDRPQTLKKLYGREAEAQRLQGATAGGTPELLPVSGPPGVGKYDLVEALRRELAKGPGRFAADRFDAIAETVDFSLIRAYRKDEGAPVLLKVLRANKSTRADLARFKHQYDRIARIASPRLMAVRGVEALATLWCVVLEDFPGRTLAQVLAVRPSRKLEVSEALALAAGLAEGLAALHAAGLIQGDMRPQNLLVGPRGEVKIVGFGVDAEITGAHERLYAPEVLADVLPYVSPEQTGRMNRSVDYRADFYSLGVLLYETLTGGRPFGAKDPMELIHAHLALEPAPPSRVDPTIPKALSGIVLKLLAKNAEDRYQSAEGLLTDLDRCQKALKGTGMIEPFALGRHDRQDLFQIHQKLYGREQDTEALSAAFDRALKGSRESVLVSGYSGIGKSSLVHEILKPLAREKGYFTSGKTDQYNREAPYSAVIEAFDGLVRQILSESEARILKWRSALLEALGPNAQVVCEVIPSLSFVVGAQPAVPSLGPLEAQNRLNRCFLQFISVFARSRHPLVLFLDDLQWIDPASLGLLRALLADTSLEALFFCGAYRDNEVTPAHPFLRALEALRRDGLIVQGIVLAPLSCPHLHQMLSDSLKRDDSGPLVEAVHKKTGGNPFFVKQFVLSLYDHGVLTYSAGSGWRWDLERIDALAYTDNVVDLMGRTLARLPETTQRALKLAAAIGNRFELDVLSTVSECSPEEAYGRLDPAVGEGFVLEGRDFYRFAHDKVQEGAYAMIPEAERPAFHLKIGRLLAGKLDLSESQSLFDVVGHMSRAGDLVSDPEERLSLARMSLEAARRAEDSSAFGAALRYLEFGLLRLPKDAWTSQYPLRLEFAKKSGLLLSLSGRHEDALAILSECLEKARGRLDRTEVLRLRMNVQVLKNDLAAALAEGLEALRLFGIDLPPFPDMAMVDAQIEVVMTLVREKTLEALPDLPPLVDPEIRAMQDVLEELLPPCWFLSPNNVGITVAKILENTLRHGLSQHAVFGCITFGMFLCGRGDIELGYRFGHAAIDLFERSPDKQSEAMLRNMWGAFVQPWREGYPACQESLLKGVHAGLETGQYIWAFYCATNAITNSLLRGLPLSDLLAEAQRYQPMRKLDTANLTMWVMGAAEQLAHQLSVETLHPAKLKGEWVDIDEVVERYRRTGNHGSLFWTSFYIVTLGVFQGAFEEAARTALSLNFEIPTTAAWHNTPALQCYAGVAFTQAADKVSPDERALYLARAENFAEKLSRWAELCPQNLAHRSALLHAELARIRGDARAAGELYDEAIALAERGGYLHDEALANELAGLSYRASGRTTLARAYLTEAHRAYGRWGALEAMRRLERAYPDLVPSGMLKGAKGIKGAEAAVPAGAALDLGSVLKASQALSGEIVLDRLLDALMRNLVENAGARRGVLLVLREGQLLVEAEYRIGEAAVQMPGATPLESRPDLPSSAIRYVARTRETVLLDDGTTDSPFGRDAGFSGTVPLSSLAAPIAYKGRLTGVVYLENDLTRSAFSADRMELIRLLSTQAAISLENARLFTDLEEEKSRLQASERRLQTSERRLQAVIQQVPAGLIIAEAPTGRFLLKNDQVDRILHQAYYPSGSIEEYGQYVGFRSDGSRLAPEDWPLARSIRTGETVTEEEVEMLWADGAQTWLSLSSTPIRDASGTITSGVVILQDITERKRREEALLASEERFSKAFKNNPTPMAVLRSKDWTFVDANERFLRLLGYPVDELHGHYAMELGPWFMDLLGEVGKRLAEGGLFRDEEVSAAGKSGEAKAMLASFESILLGGDTCYLATFVDLTERKRMEEQLRQSQKMEAIGSLAGGVAHDFNNLLTAINGYSELAMMGMEATSPIYEHLKAIRSSGERAAGLTRQLLAFSRKETVKTQVQSLNAIVAEVEGMLRRLIEENVEIKTNLSPEAGSVKVDKGQVVQILMNLVVNARDAMPKGGLILVETRRVILEKPTRNTLLEAPPGAYVALTVSDKGMGMTQEVKAKIFEPFFTTKAVGKGTGLGLSVVYGVVKRLGGGIDLQSEPGQGTSFCIYFPEVSKETLAPASGDEGRKKPETYRGNETLLVVEDEDAVRKFVRQALVAQGYQVLEARSGVEALRILQQEEQRIDLVVTDLIMPDMGGRELATHVRAHRPALPVLYTSGYSKDLGDLEKVQANEEYFLAKPFSPLDLARKVREVLEHARHAA